MNFFSSCCTKKRKDEGTPNIENPFATLNNVNRIMIQFMKEEQETGLKEIPCVVMIEKLLLASSKGAIQKKELIKMYKFMGALINQN